MRFLVDAQLPPALARWLAQKGHDAEHVGDRQMATASDTVIWDYALQSGAVIITKDEDFSQLKTLRDAGADCCLDQAAEHATQRTARMVRDYVARYFGCVRAGRNPDRSGLKAKSPSPVAPRRHRRLLA